MDSGGQVGAMRPPKRPKTPQLGAQDGPEAAQETPKTAQEPPKSCQNGLQEAAQRCLGARSRPRGAQGPPRPLPDLDFGPLFIYFGSFLKAFFPPGSPPKKHHDSENARWRERGFAALKINFDKISVPARPAQTGLVVSRKPLYVARRGPELLSAVAGPMV